MDSQTQYAQLTEVFRDVFDDDDIVVTPELTASDVDEWDSLRHIRLVAAIERRFAVNFSAAEIGRLKNVGQLVSLITEKSAG
jgi:acyl carrier protein